MTKWVVIAVAGALVAVLLTRRWSPGTRAAADDAFGRHHYVMVKFWRVWVTLIAVAVFAFAASVALRSDRADVVGAMAPATPAATSSSTTTAPSGGGGSGDGSLPWWVIAVAVAVAAVGIGAVARAGVRRRERWELESFLLENEDGSGWQPAAPPVEDVEDEETGAEGDTVELVDSVDGASVHDITRRRRRRDR
jgi:hypothetical protein